MLEMLKERKAALEAQGKKGFTLMEMLIVIAIIAVLVAIAIPVLGAQLENAREATDAANIRSAYAEVAASALQAPGDDATATVTISQTDKNSWSNTSIADIAGVDTSDLLPLGASVEVKYTASTGKITIAGKEAKTSSLDSSVAASS